MSEVIKLSKKQKFENSSWTFKLDKVNFYSYWNDLFTKKECEKIVKIGKKKGLVKGETSGKVENVRKSQITWLYPCDDMDWVFRRVTDVILNLNDRFFQFDIFGIVEGFQFTNYKAPSDKYGKHLDRAINTVARKLSISIQLTDPKDYEGGELNLYEQDEGKVMDKKQGTLIMFPSYVLHEVMPVTKGERNSLVTWVTGNQFK